MIVLDRHASARSRTNVVADIEGRRQWAHVVSALVGRLPSTERAVVILSYFKGQSHAQIAQELGIPPRAVDRAMARALTAIGRAQIP